MALRVRSGAPSGLFAGERRFPGLNGTKISNAWDDLLPRGRRGSVPEGRSDRSLARSAWTAPPQKSRPVGYGLIRAGMRTDSMIGVIAFLKKARRTFRREIP